nr:3,4-dihydroxy-2-butanone-4-phosphate synthase [uncultured Ligilactobacillus sp.]
MTNDVETAIKFLKEGKFIILADNESRENEGDLVALGSRVSPETIYQMLKIANGLMCVPISRKIAERLGFKLMVENSTDPNETPFMVTTDATYEETGVTTGVSAYDRAATIKKIADPTAKPEHFNHPGHIQPLIAQDKGIRERTGHTEATVDLAYLAHEEPVTVIIEILKENGKMARRDDLAKLSEKYQVPMITIPQLEKYLDENQIEYAAKLAE